MSRQRLRAIVIAVCTVAVASFVALLLAEFVVRMAAPQQLTVVRPDIWMPFDSVGWINRPHVNTTINTGERTTRVFTDAEGFRVGAGPQDTVGRQILLIGDSFVQALQVDHEDSFSALIQRSVSRRLGAPVVVRNAGVDGWDPPQYLWRARRALAQRRYDAILVALYVGNDVVTNSVEYRQPRQPVRSARIRVPSQLTRRAVIGAVVYPVNDFLKGHSHLYVLLKRSLDVVLMRAGLTAVQFPSEILRSEATSQRWDITARFCRRIADEAAEHGVPVLFALISTPYQVDQLEFRAFASGFDLDTSAVNLDQPNQILNAKLRALRLDVIDPLPDLRAKVRSGPGLFGRTDRHFNPAGHVAFAAAVDTALVRLLDRAPTARARSKAKVHDATSPRLPGPPGPGGLKP